MHRLIVTLLTLLLCSLLNAGPIPVANGAFNFESLPHYKGPWRISIKDNQIYDAGNKKVSAPGFNLTGMACMPTTDAEADRISIIVDRTGARVVRFHHIDWVLRAQPQKIVDLHRLAYFLSRRGIVYTLDGYSDYGNRDEQKRGILLGQYVSDPVEAAKNKAIRDAYDAYVTWLLNTPPQRKGQPPFARDVNLIGICPVNEDVLPGITETQYRKAYQWCWHLIRATGYSGLIWAANSGIPDGWKLPQPVDTHHEYWDHPYPPVYKNTSGLITRDVHWPFNGKARINTEYGDLFPKPFRSETELYWASFARDNDVQMALSFAYGTNENCWNPEVQTMDTYAYHSDPVRVSTFRIMSLTMANPKGTPVRNWHDFERTGVPYMKVAGDWQGVRTVLSTMVSPYNKSTLVYLGEDARMTGQLWTSSTIYDRLMTSLGVLPIVEYATARQVSVATSGTPSAVWVLDSFTGERKQAVSFTYADGKVTFTATGAFWYEVVNAPSA